MKTELPAEAYAAVGLTEKEYRRILALLGRTPTPEELGMFGVLWSEHCAYKHSRPVLRGLPTEGPHVLVGPGENAGVVDIGGDMAVAFRMESHNHPVAVEPYQGAATGVGGIIRDILAMGARPVALLDSLRFGDSENARTRFLFDGVVRGISGYGNAIGVPTVGGEIVFDPAYQENPLCNVMCIGILPKARLTRARAEGEGNLLILVGAPTGRDGIHGATFASATLGESVEESRPQVQVGDPFRGKLLIEACLEMAGSGAVVGIQDLGAAGITSSSAETASRAGSGARIDLAHVPRREPAMTAEELLLSESQERMLVIAKRGREGEILAIAARWELPAMVIGEVTSDGLLTIRDGEREVARLSARLLTDEAPVYEVEGRPPAYLEETRRDDGAFEVEDWQEAIGRFLRYPSVASPAWIYRQYDHQVGGATEAGPGAAAAVLQIPGSPSLLAASVNGNGRYTHLDPRQGGRQAVAGAVRNLVSAGARPVGLTNCLNFGNPERPEVSYQFREAVQGLGEAAKRLGAPVTGGNVSFYNEGPSGSIYPTPVVGVVGMLPPGRPPLPGGFAAPGQILVLVGDFGGHLGGSLALALLGGRVAGLPPVVDLEREAQAMELVLTAAAEGLLASVRDLGEGGLLLAILKSGFAAAPGCRGARMELPAVPSPTALLLGEDQGRYLVALEAGMEGPFRALADRHGVPVHRLGTVTGSELSVRIGDREVLAADVEGLMGIWEAAMGEMMAG